MNTVFADERVYSAPAAACAADLMCLLAQSPQALTTTELARDTGTSRSLVFRVLQELESRQIVRRVSDTQFVLGSRVLEMGAAYITQSPYAEAVRDVLHALAEATGQITNLGILEGGDVLYIMKEEPQGSVVTISHIGHRLPANCSSMGKILLAQLSRDDLASLLPANLPALTSKSIVDHHSLKAAIDAAREQGFASETGESVAGRSCLAVAVPLPGSKSPAAISVSMTDEYFQSYREEACAALMRAQEFMKREASGRNTLKDREGGLLGRGISGFGLA